MTLITWEAFAMMGITISALIVTVVFMLSYMFNNEFLKSWSKSEFLNIFLTLIIFGSLLSLVRLPLFSNNVISAREYVGNLFENVLDIQTSIISDVSTLSFLGSLSFFLNPNLMTEMSRGSGGGQGNEKTGDGNEIGHAAEALSVYISLNSFISPIVTSITTLQVYSFIPITMIKLHHLLIDFIHNDSVRTFPILLAAGVFLRAFKFSRNAGNTFLAIFISFYFILPVMYLFNYELIKVVLPEEDSGKGFVTELSNLMMNEIRAFTFSKVFDESDEYGLSMGNKLYNRITPEGSLYGFVVRFFVEGLFLPYLAIIVALGAAREFAMTLGSNIDFSSLVRLV